MLGVAFCTVMLSVVMLNVFMLSVAAPHKHLIKFKIMENFQKRID